MTEAKLGQDVQQYEEVLSAIKELDLSEPKVSRDVAWIEATKKQAKVETNKLEAELKGYKNNLINEIIRVSVVSHQNVLQMSG